MIRHLRVFQLLFLCSLVSHTLWGQSGINSGAIAGVAVDSSGSAVVGATVEVSSPVLIEKTRSTVTDDQGLYKIVNLPPGTYSVVFTANGFNVFRREGVELT